jgi:hypothetical protein
VIGAPTGGLALPSWDSSQVGTAFFVAVIGLAVVAGVAYAVDEHGRLGVAIVAFGLWTVVGCAVVVAVRGLTGNPVLTHNYPIPYGYPEVIGPVGVPEPGGVIFAVACAAWTAPFVTIAWRRRRLAWIAVATSAVGVATAGALAQFVHDPGALYDQGPPWPLILAMVAVAIWATILYAHGSDTIPAPGRWARAVLGQAFFIAWVLISLAFMVVGIALSEEPCLAAAGGGPGPPIFSAACAFWTVPYLVLARRRRTPTWIIIGLVSIAVAVFGIMYLLASPAPPGCEGG